MSFELADLPYARDALMPYMSAETMEFHHGKHHMTYLTNLNNLLKEGGFDGQTLEQIIVASQGKHVGIYNNSGQHYNHNMFWLSMKPQGGGAVPGKLEKALIDSFGSVEKAKEDFIQAGLTQFGSGWAWFGVKDGKIAIYKTANADSPLTAGVVPLLTADVWEHAYYIDYRNRRLDFLKAFMSDLVNWEFAAQNFEKAVG